MLRNLFDPNVIHIDNMKILKALIYARDEKLPLLDGATKRLVGLSYQIITAASSFFINRHLLLDLFQNFVVVYCTGWPGRSEKEKCALAHFKPRILQ